MSRVYVLHILVLKCTVQYFSTFTFCSRIYVFCALVFSTEILITVTLICLSIVFDFFVFVLEVDFNKKYFCTPYICNPKKFSRCVNIIT